MTSRVMDGWNKLSDDGVGLVLIHPEKQVYFGIFFFLFIPYRITWGVFPSKEDAKIADRFMREARVITLLRFLDSLERLAK